MYQPHKWNSRWVFYRKLPKGIKFRKKIVDKTINIIICLYNVVYGFDTPEENNLTRLSST